MLVTVHGEYVWEDFDDATLERLRTHGFAYYVHDPAGPPDFQTSYQSEAYVRERFARRFRVLAYHPRGLNRHQDVVVLEKP